MVSEIPTPQPAKAALKSALVAGLGGSGPGLIEAVIWCAADHGWKRARSHHDQDSLAREPQADIGAWTQRLQGFQLAEDHTHDPTLELPRQLLPLMTAALSAQTDRCLTGDAGTRSLFPDGKFRSLKVLTLGE